MPELLANQPPPADYYAANLRKLFEFVRSRHSDLLDESAAELTDAFLCASVDAQRLFARLITRKGPWIRQDKLVYAEVGNLSGALEELHACGLTEHAETAPADFLLTTLVTAERRALFPKLPVQKRDDWILDCISRYPEPLIRRRLRQHCSWVAVATPRALALTQMLYFGDAAHDTSAFVLEDLGVVRYPEYSLARARRLFPDLAALQRYQRLRRLRHLCHRLTEAQGMDRYLADHFWSQPVLRHERRLHDTCLNTLARHFERRGEFDDALSCYARSNSHPARERRVRLLRKLGDEHSAGILLNEMAAAPLTAEEEDFAERAGSRGRRRCVPETTTLALNGPTPDRIEDHAAQLLSSAGGQAWHVENQLPLMLAGLIYWDIVFAPVPGAFVNPYQSAPLDLFWPDFSSTRSALLAQRDAQVASGSCRFADLLENHYQRYQGLANRLVNWQFWTEGRIQILLSHVPEVHLASLARYVIQGPYRARRGFPDLLVIYGRGSYELVEVKGPTDALQPAQRVWLKNLRHMNVPARVLKFKP